MVSILAKEYSDKEIEKPRKNPYVYHVSRHRLSLTLDFRNYMYDVWLQNPVPSTNMDLEKLSFIKCNGEIIQ